MDKFADYEADQENVVVDPVDNEIVVNVVSVGFAWPKRSAKPRSNEIVGHARVEYSCTRSRLY